MTHEPGNNDPEVPPPPRPGPLTPAPIFDSAAAQVSGDRSAAVRGLLKRAIATTLTAAFVFVATAGSYALATRTPEMDRVAVAPGVTLTVGRLSPDAAGYGRYYLATIDLDPSKLDLFVTPPDPRFDNTPFTHRLAHTADEAAFRGLTVAVNASLFLSPSYPIRRAGAPAIANETTVSDWKVVRYWEHTYMLGFTPELNPAPQRNKPPPVDKLPGWKWAIGTQAWIAYEGRFNPYDTEPSRRTVFAVSADGRRLTLAVFERASSRRIYDELTARGNPWIGGLDGGESSAMALGGRALTGDWRPVANHVGARPR